MAEMKLIERDTLQEIADAIKEKEATIDLIPVDEYAERIRAIEGGKVRLQAKIATPTAEGTVVEPDKGYGGLSVVTIEGDENLKAENIAEGVSIFGVTGTHANKLAQYMGKTVTELNEDDFDGVESIPEKAFYQHTSIKKAVIPSNVKSIGTSAFSGCTGIESFELAEGVETFGQSAFVNLQGMGNSFFIIPQSVSAIPKTCFSSSKFKGLFIPKSITSCGQQAFSNCSIGGIYIDDLSAFCKISIYNGGYTMTPTHAPLYYKRSLYLNGEIVKDLVIPEDITEILVNTFCGGNFDSVTFHENVTSIGYHSFREATVGSFIVKATTPPTLDSGFASDASITEILVPIGYGDTYKSATNWSSKASIIKEDARAGGASTQLPTPTIQMEMGELYINDFGAAEGADFYWSADGNESWQHLGSYEFAGVGDQECIYESTLYEWLEAIGRNNSDTVTYVHCITHATGYQDSLASNTVTVNGANT